MLSLYLSQPSWLHKLPAGVKLLILAASSVALLPLNSLAPLLAAMALGVVGHLSLGPAGRRRLLGLIKSLLLMLVFLGLAQWIASVLSLGWEVAFTLALEQASVTVLRILALVLLANLVTLSSTTQELLHALRFVLAPLRWLGLSTQTLSLAMALVFRWVNLLNTEWQAIREGFLCRGCRRPSLKSATPLLRRSQLLSQAMGDALAARLKDSRKYPPLDQAHHESSAITHYQLATPQIAMTYQLSDFDFELPEELIAQAPMQVRSQSRLLDVRGEDEFRDRTFTELIELLNPEDLLVFNNSKVIAARLFAQKPSGGRVEILVERIGPAPNQASVLLRVSRKPVAGMRLQLESHEEVLCLGRDPAHDDRFLLQFNRPVLNVLDDLGQLPLPPYIGHAPTKDDLQRYQTVYAQHPGSVAAPTAGLHFDETLFAALQAKGIQRAEVTLHVGSGTFAPVRDNDLSKHRMHFEWCSLSEETEQKILKTKAQGGRVVAVGTTSLRTLESAGQRAMGAKDLNSNSGAAKLADFAGLTGLAGQWETDLFITPGYQFKVVDALVTNFHLPKSTLLMLVSAFASYPTIRKAYDHAINSRYRFFSYGDAMFLRCSSQI